MNCPDCQNGNQEDAVFCAHCKTRLKSVCPLCDKANPLQSKYCNQCGCSLDGSETKPPIDYSQPHSYTPKFLADKILNSSSAVIGERKIVTVLFADVVNSTGIFERLDPEKVHSIMDGCFRIMMDEIHKCEGTVNQFRGDGIMSLFGAPLAHEDHAQRACYAALQIQKALIPFAEEVKSQTGRDFKVRIGLNSGPVVVGSIGDDLRMDYTADGDTVNLAARMETMATPGTVLVSKSTYDRVCRHFVFDSLGKFKVKGKEKHQKVYRLSGQNHLSRFSSDRQIFSDMVGRKSELDRLELHILKAKNGEGSIVNVIGEAGIGKTKLIAELKERQSINDVYILEGRAISMGRNLSFYPIIEIIKAWANINEQDPEHVVRTKLESAIRAIYPEQADEIIPFTATMMGIKLYGKYAQRVSGIEGEALEKLIQKNLRDLILKASELSTIVFIMEDLHWADTSSIELLMSLFRLVNNNRILFINIFRPYYKATGEKLLNAIFENFPDLHKAIYIQPLNRNHSDRLIDNLLKVKGLPRDIRDMIHIRSEGNPYFIEEILRSFIDEGVVKKKNGNYVVSGDLKSIVIPSTIQELLTTRIDRLDDSSKSLLKTASVIGRNFFYKILVNVGGEIPHIDAELQVLKEAQLIIEDKRMGEVEYQFKHALIQETVYESILRQNRKKIHHRVAVSTRQIFKNRLNEFYGMLAYHYSSAEDLTEAAKFLKKAGEEALKSSASSEAINYYLEAFNLYKIQTGQAANPEEVASFEKNIAVALYNKGQHEESVEYFDRALNHYWRSLPKSPLAVSVSLISAFLHLLISLYLPSFKFKRAPTEKDIQIADLFFKKSKALVTFNPKRFFLESLYICKRITKFDLAEFGLGMEIFVGASALFSFTGISLRLSRKILDAAAAMINKNNSRQYTLYELLETVQNYVTGNWKAIRGFNNELINQNLTIGEVYLVAQHLYWHGFPMIYKGESGQIKLIISLIKRLRDEYDNDFLKFIKYDLNKTYLLEWRKIPEALIEIDRGIEFAHKAGFGLGLIDLHACKARIHLLMDDFKQAKINLNHASNIISDKNPVPGQVTSYYRTLLEYYLCGLKSKSTHVDDSELFDFHKKAAATAKTLLKISKKTAQHRTEAYRLKGELHWLTHNKSKAFKWWRLALECGCQAGANLELARTYLDIGKYLLESGDKYQSLNKTGGREFIQKARGLFEKMDLDWDLEKSNYIDLTAATKQQSATVNE